MKKLIGALLITLTVLTCFAMGISANTAATVISDEGLLPFDDCYSDQWYTEGVVFCYANSIMRGMNEYTFAPNGYLTRAQFVTVLANLEDVDTGKYSVTKFTDVKSSAWYHGAVAWAYEKGVVSGYSDGSFAPNREITRQELAVVMSQYMKKKGYEVTIQNNALNKYYNVDMLGSWAKDAMKYMVSAGIISGTNENLDLAPQGYVTRAQAARILMLYMRNYLNGDCEHAFSESDCTTPSVCAKCGMVEGLAQGHVVANEYNCITSATCFECGTGVAPSKYIHDFTETTCSKPRTCKLCGITRGSTLPHTWWYATCKNPKMCKVCYKTEGKALGHKWVRADCISPKRCTRCKLTEGSPITTNKQHTWWSATCVNPKMCKVCYVTSGSKLGHNWERADCLNPKRCTRWGCGVTEGTALSKNKQHTWWSATCINPKICKVCYKTEGKALGHSYSANSCIRCPEPSPYVKVVNYLKQNGKHIGNNVYTTYISGYGGTGGIFYNASTGECGIFGGEEYDSYFGKVSFYATVIYLPKTGTTCRYEYISSSSEKGVGYFDAKKLIISNLPGFSSYEGNASSVDKAYEKAKSGAAIAVWEMTELKRCGVTLKDFGFANY